MEVENKKTGNLEIKDAVWVKKLGTGLELQKYEDKSNTKSGSKQFVTDKPTTAVMQSISKRIGNFAAWPIACFASLIFEFNLSQNWLVALYFLSFFRFRNWLCCVELSLEVTFQHDSDFFSSPALIDMHLLEDDFVPAGSDGTASGKKKKGNKSGGNKGGRPDKLVDVSLIRSQSTSKLVSQKTFCQKALQEAVQAAEEFQSQHPALEQKYIELRDNGVAEAGKRLKYIKS